MNKTGNLASAFVLLSVLLLSACATAPSASSPDDIVLERAKARWEAILSRDYATAYALYSPGYRSMTSVTDYEFEIRLRKVRWLSAEYQRHSCEKSRCAVKFRVGYKVNSPVPGVDTWTGYDLIEDQWVKTGGEWWYLPEE